jgi:hypothetical protein
MSTPTNKDVLNQADPNTLPDTLRAMGFGSMLRSMTVHLNRAAPVAGALANGNLTTVDVIHLPDDAKACTILRATGRAGGTVDEFTPQAYGATPATTQCAVAPNGDIAFVHATDLVTDVDIEYVPMKGDVVEAILPCVAGVCTLPTSWTNAGVKMLLEAEVLAGAVTGLKQVLVPLAGGGAGLPATTKVQLTSGKTTASFNNATDVPTSCRVRALIVSAKDPNAVLEAAATY